MDIMEYLPGTKFYVMVRDSDLCSPPYAVAECENIEEARRIRKQYWHGTKTAWIQPSKPAFRKDL